MVTDTSSVPKAALRIREAVAAGSYYEAQQMYKAAYHRHRSRKQSEESYSILQEGALQQLQAGQMTCGVELGMLLVAAYTQDHVPPVPASLAPLISIIKAMPSPMPAADAPDAASQPGVLQTPGSSSGSSGLGAAAGNGAGPGSREEGALMQEALRFMSAATIWAGSSRAGLGARPLHDAFAMWLWAHCGVRQLARVLAHLCRGSDIPAFVSVLRGCMALAPPEEEDLFITHAVLQVLAAARKGSAAFQLGHATQLLQQLGGAGPAQACNDAAAVAAGMPSAPQPGGQRAPLVTFCTLLLQALQRQSLPLVRLLRDRYQPLLALDPLLESLLDRVESVYLRVKQGGGGGPFGGLLASLMSSFGEMGEETEEEVEEEEEDNTDGSHMDSAPFTDAVEALD